MANEGDNWTPPTEAEIKVLQAKRERSDKISRIMADYLLRGYKMLGTNCDHCGAVLLQDRARKSYCVACSEVDNEHAKDNPALSGTAAQRQIEESQFSRSCEASTFDSIFSNATIATTENLISAEAPGSSDVSHGNEEDLQACIQAVHEKMVWASKKLSKTNSPEASLQWCSLLKVCAESLVAIREAQSSEFTIKSCSRQ